MYLFIFVSLFLLIVYAIAERLTGTNQSNSLAKMLKRLAKRFRLQFIIQVKLNWKFSDATTEKPTCICYSMALFSVICDEYSENTGIEVDRLVRVKYQS